MLNNRCLGSKTTRLLHFFQVQLELRWTIWTIAHNSIKYKEWQHQKLPLLLHQPSVYRSLCVENLYYCHFIILRNSVQKPKQFLFLLWCCASCITNIMYPEVRTVSNLLCTQYYYVLCWSEILLHAKMWKTVIFVSKRQLLSYLLLMCLNKSFYSRMFGDN